MVPPVIPNLPNNLTDQVGNSLGSALPNIPSTSAIPNVSGSLNFNAPSVPAGVDPCSSLSYLKSKITTMPLIGNLSLKDLAPNIDLEGLMKLTAVPSLCVLAVTPKAGTLPL